MTLDERRLRIGTPSLWCGRAARAGCLLSLFTLAASTLEAQVLSGSYVGNTTGQSISGLGFQPDVVIVKGNTALPAVIRTATMGAGLSKDMVSNVAPLAATILSFDPSGFTVGSSATVNAGGTTYQWVAFKAVAGQLTLGSYVGTGVDNLSITGIGFQPDYVVVASQNWRPIQRSSAMAGDTSVSFEGAPAPNLIQVLQADGFQVGSNLEVNESGATIHYAAWKAIPGSMAVGAYTGGSPADNRQISVGFLPEYAIVKRDTNLGVGAGVHKAASSGLLTDIASRFDAAVNQVDMIQALQADGFQVGGDPRANSATAPNVYYWAAFGPHQPKTSYRSIGTAADYTTGTVGATAGSDLVLGIGTLWVSANRGRGDRILIEGTNYTIASVDSETQLRLTTAFIGGTGVGKAYTISRQHTTLSGWEDCVDGGPCPFFPVASNNLVADDRSELGIAYDDAVGTDFAGGLTIDGSVTDAAHTITLTADGSNRHYGLPGQGVVINNGASVVQAVALFDDFVTIEWMEVTGGGGTADGIRANLLSPGTSSLVTVRSNLVHNVPGDGISIFDADGRVDVYNNVVHGNAVGGLWVNPTSLAAGTRFRILNNTFYGNTGGVGKSPGVSAAATLLVRNNISVGNAGPDYACDPADSVDPASSNNLDEDNSGGTGAGTHNPAGGRVTSTIAALAFVNAGGGDLHIQGGSTARDVGADLSSVFTTDIDAVIRQSPWDVGADEAPAAALFRSVGITATALASGAANAVTISGSTATFAGALPDNIGVGDAIQYDSDNNGSIDALAFIHGRTNSQTYTVEDKSGAAPIPTATPDMDWAIYRAYTSLFNWEAQTENPAINAVVRDFDTSTNLVSTNTTMNVACYGDGADTTPVTVAGWTTGVDRYIRIYTPYSAFEVGTSQRHAGTWNATTAYRLQAAPPINSGTLWIQTNHVRVDGLQVWQTNDNDYTAAIYMNGAAGVSSYETSNNIVRGVGGAPSKPGRIGIQIYLGGTAGSVAKIWNNLVYDFNGLQIDVAGILLDDPEFTHYVYNNTVVDGGQGIAQYSGVVLAKNNLAYNNSDNWNGTFSAASTNNLSGPGADPQIPATNARNGVTVTFVNAALDDFHLAGSDLGALDRGTDLSADSNLAFASDIDGGARAGAWEIGADEAGAGITANLGITKDDGQTTAVPGNSITYTITVTNNGPDTVTSLFVNDSLPALTGVSFTPSTGTYNSGTGEWTGLSLATSQSVTLTLTGTIDPFARGNLVNPVSVSPPAGVTDTNGANDFASDTDSLDPSVDVQVVKTDDVDPAPLGGLLTYTLTVTNNGPSGATNASVQDPLPPDMDLDAGPGAITPSQGTCNYDGLSRTVSCDLGSLGPTLSATVVIKVRPQALRLFNNTATTNRNEPDSTPGNNAESETTSVEVSSLAVRFFTATSTNQRNVLEWINPSDADYVSTEIMVRGDRFPTGPGDGVSLYNSGAGGSGGRVKLPHATGALSNGQTFFYGAFVHRASAPLVSPGRFVTGRPFDHTAGPVKWAFSTGATALTPPTVGGAGVIATSNDKVLYAMERGVDDDQLLVDSGEWPASFEPIDVGGPVQGRSPVVPISVGGANPVVFVGSQDGNVYAIDATAGGSVPYLWVTSVATPPDATVQAAPAGIFSAFNSATLDYILVGTRDTVGPNALVALHPYLGGEIDRFDNSVAGPQIGIVNGMAAVDYGPPPFVYFTSHERPAGSTDTLWCLELKQEPAPVFIFRWARALGDIDSSPVLRGGRVYVGSAPLAGTGTVYSIDALDGDNTALDRTFVHNDGQVRGFIFPDRASSDIYFATDDFVWGVTDTGAATMTVKFGGPISLPGAARPSPVLFVPGSHYLYVGGSDGKLYEIDTLQASPVPNLVTLGNGLAVVGTPSLDRVYNLVHVGTEAGIFYAVQIPLP